MMMHAADVLRAPIRQAFRTAAALLALAVTTQTKAAEEDATLSSAQLGATFGTIESADNSNKSVQVDFRFTAPVTRFLGASLNGTFADTNLQTDAPTDEISSILCSYETLGTRGTLFAREPSLGRVSASFLAGQLRSKCGGSASFVERNSDTLRSEGYSLAAEYYFPALTLAAERTSTSFDGDNHHVTDLLTASWYLLPDLSISPNAGRVNGSNLYGLTVEHQPDFLGQSASVTLAFSQQNLESGSIRSISLAFTYHFGTHVDLKKRDRQYR